MVHVRPCNRVPVRVFAVVNVCLCVRAPVWGLQVTARDSRRTAQRSTSQRTTRRFCCRYRMTLTRTVPQCNAHLTGERALTQCVRKTRVVCARGPCLLRLATRAMGSKRALTLTCARRVAARVAASRLSRAMCAILPSSNGRFPGASTRRFPPPAPLRYTPTANATCPAPGPKGQTAHPKPHTPNPTTQRSNLT